MKRENKIFTAPFMDSQLDKAAWEHISSETAVPVIYAKLLQDYSDKLNWESISENYNINWNIDLLRKYIDRICWCKITKTLFTSMHYSAIHIESWRLEDVIEFIDEFKDRWNWDELSYLIDHPQIDELLDRYASKLSWDNIADNRNIKWTPKLVSKYEKYFAEVEDIENTYLWSELTERRTLEIIAEIFEK